MSSKRILVAGCGQIGLRVAKLLAPSHQVWGLKRTVETRHDTIKFISADVTQARSLKEKLPDNLDYLIYCLTPSAHDEQGYRAVYQQGLQNLLAALPQKQALSRLYFISSTGIYSQNDQGWVDENSPAQPTHYSGQIMLQAETDAKSSIHPSTSIRFSGIYGRNRTRLIKQVEKGVATLSNSCRLSNRIHEDDCVGFIHHLIQQEANGQNSLSLYLASDSAPVDLNEVFEFIAKQLSVDLGSLEINEHVRRTGNKKCSNKRMLESGYVLRFPSYREGYLEMLSHYQTQLR